MFDGRNKQRDASHDCMGRPSVVSFTHGGVARAEAVSPLTGASPIVEIETGGRERGGRFRFRLQGTETVVELATTGYNW